MEELARIPDAPWCADARRQMRALLARQMRDHRMLRAAHVATALLCVASCVLLFIAVGIDVAAGQRAGALLPAAGAGTALAALVASVVALSPRLESMQAAGRTYGAIRALMRSTDDFSDEPGGDGEGAESEGAASDGGWRGGAWDEEARAAVAGGAQVAGVPVVTAAKSAALLRRPSAATVAPRARYARVARCLRELDDAPHELWPMSTV